MKRLRACQQAGWSAPTNHPDLSPANESLQFWEHIRELGRNESLKTKPPGFRELLDASERSAGELHRALREVPPVPGNASAMEARRRAVAESCTACHVRYRNQEGS